MHHQTADFESFRCALFVQSMQDIANVWMTTAGLVWCDIPLCRKHGAKTATQSLYCRDPDYVPLPGTGAGRRPILYSTGVSNDWGADATYVRDDDMKLVVKMVHGLFRGEIVNTPNLFHANQETFTSAETIECLGFSTMTENAKKTFSREIGGNGARTMTYAACWAQCQPCIKGWTVSQTIKTIARTGNQKLVKKLQATRPCARMMAYAKALQTLSRTTWRTMAHLSVSTETCVLSLEN